MPRRARMYLPGLPVHVVQRGNCCEACFVEPENYRFYVPLWGALCERAGIDPGDTPLDDAVVRLVTGSNLVGRTALENPEPAGGTGARRPSGMCNLDGGVP